jgi:hypothetical protein
VDVRDYIRAQFRQAHQVLEGILADCTDDALDFRPGGSLGSAAGILPHIVHAEDILVNGATGRPIVWERDRWENRAGVEMGGLRQDPAWTDRVRITPAFREYMQAVFANTDDAVAALPPDSLETPFQGTFGESTPARSLSIAVYHLAQHSGEIAAIKGMQGLQGLPF